MAVVEFIDVEVRPSQNYQTVGFSTRIVFNSAVSLEEAKFEADLAYEELKDIALKRVAELASLREATSPPQQAGPLFTSAPASRSAEWQVAHKPNGAGSFRYLPTSVVSKEDFIRMAEAKFSELGLDPAEVIVFDDRGGERGIEVGEKYYCAGKVKARQDSRIAAAMQGKAIVANVDFTESGDVKVTMSRDGKSALQALQIAGRLAAPVEF